MKKQLQILFTTADEDALLLRLKEHYSSMAVIDGSVWRSREPPVAPSFAACESSIVMLWDREAAPVLPCKMRPDGRFDGPIVGPVMQLVRSRQEDDVLLSGRIAASSDVPAVENVIRGVWRIVRLWGTAKVRSVNPATGDTINPKVPGYVIGPDAASWWSVERARLLRDRSTQNYLAPAEE